MRAVLGEGLLDFPTPAYATTGQGLARARSSSTPCGAAPLLGAALAPHSAYATGPTPWPEAAIWPPAWACRDDPRRRKRADERRSAWKNTACARWSCWRAWACLGPGTVLYTNPT